MSYRCQICGKGSLHGVTHRHGRGVASKRFENKAPSTKRLWRPNLQSVKVDGKKMLICAKCLKRLKKDGKVVLGRKKSKKAVSVPLRPTKSNSGKIGFKEPKVEKSSSKKKA